MYLWPQFWNPAWLGGSTRDSADPGLEPGRIEEKIGEGTTRCDPADPAPRSKTRLRSVNFCFFCFLLKWRHFDFFLKENWLGQPSDPVKTQDPGLGPGRSPGWVWKLCLGQLFYLFIYLCYFSIYPRNRHLQLIRMGDSTA
jgi:hypothetical protein